MIILAENSICRWFLCFDFLLRCCFLAAILFHRFRSVVLITMLPFRFTHLLLLAAAIAGCGTAQIPTRSLPPATAPWIEWNVSLHDSLADHFALRAKLHNITADTILFRFPNWSPGAYQRVEYGQYVSNLTATSSAGVALPVTRESPSTFRVAGVGNGAVLRYAAQEINDHPNSPFMALSAITDRFAFANGTALHGYVEGELHVPQVITYSFSKDWEVSTGLSPADSLPNSFVASNYDELVDAPLLAGQLQKFEVTVEGKPHLFAIVAPEPIKKWQRENLLKATKQIVESTSSFFGEMPYSHYLFQCFLMDRWGNTGYGALEHRNSSTYLMPWGPWSFSALEAVIAHEYWHVWFPKRTHTHELGPFDYQHPPATSALWFIEGITEYYSQKMLVQAKRQPGKQMLLELMTALYDPDAISKQSLEEVSRAASTTPITSLRPIYARGAVVGMLLDCEIRTQTNNARSLDDAMRLMNNEYGKLGKTFGEDEIIGIIERATGTQLQELYRAWVASAAPLPLPEFAPKMGLRFVPDQRFSVYGLQGMNLLLDSLNRWMIDSLVPGSIADSMGLQHGDELVSFSQNIAAHDSVLALSNLSTNQITTLIHFLPANTTACTVRRNGQMQRLPVLFRQVRPPIGLLEPDPDATGIPLQIRESMFGI